MAHTCARTGMKILHQWWLETSNANSVVQPVDDVTQFLRPLAPTPSRPNTLTTKFPVGCHKKQN